MAIARRLAVGMARASRSARAKAKPENNYEAPVVLLPTGSHTHTAVLLHGMYRRGKDFAQLKDQFAQLGIHASGVKCIFPNSPTISISWPRCREDGVHAWYNYYTCKNGCDEHDEIDTLQLEEQSNRICSILDEELAHVGGDARHLILGGNSQGGTVALHAAMAFGQTLGAVIAMRTCLIDTVTRVSPGLVGMPIFIFAAERDGVYTLSLQQRCFRKFEDAGYQVTWHVEPRLIHMARSKTELCYAAKWMGNVWFAHTADVKVHDVSLAGTLPPFLTDAQQIIDAGLEHFNWL